MYAVIRSGGKQYKVIKGESLRVSNMAAEEGAEVNFEVLAFHNGETLTLGTPIVESAKVTGKVVAHGRGRKIIVYRFKRRKGYHRKKGHRQDYTEVMIQDIVAV